MDLTRGSRHLAQFCFSEDLFFFQDSYQPHSIPCSALAIFFPVWGFFLSRTVPASFERSSFLHLALSRNGSPSWPLGSLLAAGPGCLMFLLCSLYSSPLRFRFKTVSCLSLTAQNFGEPPCIDFFILPFDSSSPFIGLQDVPEAFGHY